MSDSGQGSDGTEHWAVHCSRCSDELADGRDATLCKSCSREIEMKRRERGDRCERCDGHGYIYGTYCDLQRAMDGRDKRCPVCHGSGRVAYEPDDGLVTDGGTERRNPTEGPRACSRCGVHIGFLGDNYCDPCAREIGARGEMVRCMGCGQDGPEEHMESVDISEPDEYYPTIRYLCRDCSGGESA